MIGQEIEFKYNAKDISLEAFKQFCKFFNGPSPSTYFENSGYDYFYSNPKDNTEFLRHRIGNDINQLTFKRKLKTQDNFVRIEHNIDLSKNTSIDSIKALVDSLGFEYNTKVFKSSFIFVFHDFIAAYYIVYDDNMKETNRFLEIELDEYKENTELSDLVVLERLFKPLGVGPKQRILPSLFEMYRR